MLEVYSAQNESSVYLTVICAVLFFAGFLLGKR